MSDDIQTTHTITRRGFLRAGAGSLLALPAIGGVGIFSRARVAQALTVQDEAGGTFTNEELAKITVVTRTEMAVVAVDVAKIPPTTVVTSEGLESGAIPPEAYVVGAKVRVTSRYNGKTVEGATDAEGKIIFDIRELSENLENKDINKLDEYAFNATLQIDCDGFRTFQTALFRAEGTGVFVATTRSIEPGDSTPYPHMISYDEWDILYTRNTFLTSTENTDEMSVVVEGRNFPDGAATVIVREKDAGAELASVTATPSGGNLTATLKGQFGLLGGANAFKQGVEYEVAVIQSSKVYTWPVQLQMKEGVLSKAVEAAPEYSIFKMANTSGDKSALNITWPNWVPIFGGQKANIMSPIKTPLAITLDPYGFCQITYTIPLYGYKYDSGEPDKAGWKKQPYDSAKDAYKKYEKKFSEMVDQKAPTAYANKNKYGYSKIAMGSVFDIMVYLQVMAVSKWDTEKSIFQGDGGGQLHLSCNYTFTWNFWAGPVPFLITCGFNFDAVASLMFGITSKMVDGLSGTDLASFLPGFLLDPTSWDIDFTNTGLSVSVTFAPFLSFGIGLAGVASASVRGKFILSFYFGLTAAKNRPLPHVIGTMAAKVEVVLQFIFYTQTYALDGLSLKETKLFDNWDGSVQSQAEGLKSQADGPAGSLPDLAGGMRIVTAKMMEKTAEATGKLSQPLTTASDGSLVPQGDIGPSSINWSEAKKKIEDKKLGITYNSYTFKVERPKRAGQSDAQPAAAPSQSSPLSTQAEPAADAPTAAAPADASSTTQPTTDASGASQASGVVAGAAAAATALGADAEKSVPDAAATAAGGASADAAAAATASPAADSDAASPTADPAAAPSDTPAQQQDQAKADEKSDAKLDAQSDEKAKVATIRPHIGSSVSYADSFIAPSGDGLSAQDDGAFLPDPGVKEVKVTGGVRPTSDVIISTDAAGEEQLVAGDPRMRVIDIRTSSSSGASTRATCSFRIGTVNIEGTGVRSRLIMTVLDASGDYASFIGLQRVIDFDINDIAGVDHKDLFDYEFGLAFSQFTSKAGGVEANIDQIEIVLVSGKRSAGDSTSIAAAGTDLYFTYLQFYAQDLLAEDFSNPLYVQYSLPGSQVLTPESTTPDGVHNISNIYCVPMGNDSATNGSLLVAFLDRKADSAANVFSDNKSLVTVRPRFVLLATDQDYVTVNIPDTTALDDRLNMNDFDFASVIRMTLSPRIAGLYTLTLQAPSNSFFYVFDFDENGVFTTASQCPMLDPRSMSLIPWVEQDCFLTSFANEAYRSTAEFLRGGPDTWDYTQWTLQKASWHDTGSPAGSHVLYFEEIGPSGFNFSRFALNSSGTFLFWPEGRTGSDEIFYDENGERLEPVGTDDAVYHIMACRVRKNDEGVLHFSDPFVAADVPHSMDQLAAVTTHDRYAPFEVLSSELVDTGETMTPSGSSEKVTLYHAARLWYTSVPNLQCCTVVGSACTLPAVPAGGTAKFDVTIRNDGNSFLSGCTLQMYRHDIEIDADQNPIRDAEGNYIDHGVTPVNAAFKLTFDENSLQASSYNPADDEGKPTDIEPDYALPPGKRSIYRVEVDIPEDWAGVCFISFNATDPVMAEGGGLAAMDDDEPVFQTFSVEPGTYPVVQNRLTPDASKTRTFQHSVSVSDPTSGIFGYADSPTTVTDIDPNSAAARRSRLPDTADPTSMLPLGLGAAGAALAAYGMRRAQVEREESEGEKD